MNELTGVTTMLNDKFFWFIGMSMGYIALAYLHWKTFHLVAN